MADLACHPSLSEFTAPNYTYYQNKRIVPFGPVRVQEHGHVYLVYPGDARHPHTPKSSGLNRSTITKGKDPKSLLRLLRVQRARIEGECDFDASVDEQGQLQWRQGKSSTARL